MKFGVNLFGGNLKENIHGLIVHAGKKKVDKRRSETLAEI